MTTPEFSRPIDIRQADGKDMHIAADASERAALARRFGLVRIDRLEARVSLSRRDRTVDATGRLSADIVQSCAVSAEDLPVAVAEDFAFRFVPEASGHLPDEEIELDAEDCDEIEYAGTHCDIGEAVAQSLALAIDPFLTGPNADEARRKAGIVAPEDNSPFAVLKGLQPKE
ncbi:YceD family protein [Novosphingobium album (ex Liu et al. 2023)]|uniref:YceD family protein n=1 Tax=Novosphingobium album (ex Liu et al. 2023) TaxID=3031130 RepID=A0ABT5WSX2_9SPHN|nr:YceD family protein [Novosphingobium album (ex Liu et al. 2023)]MDE8653153.1 YceD family protein [Novosphingobium album (ex Liu et al. 2023)]